LAVRDGEPPAGENTSLTGFFNGEDSGERRTGRIIGLREPLRR